MNNTEEMELSQEEVEYFMLKYLRDETNKGRKYVEVRELYEYLGGEIPENMENEKITFNPHGKKVIQNFEEKHRKYLN